MDEHTYRAYRVINAGRIILALKRGFSKDKGLYEELEKELEQEWKRKKEKYGENDKPRHFKVNQYVIVESGGYKRAVITDCLKTAKNGTTYSVFLYDHGVFEDVLVGQMIKLKSHFRKKLTPRTTIVTLLGLSPAKLVADPLKKNPDGTNVEVLTQTGEWSMKTNKLVDNWLNSSNIRYLKLYVVKRLKKENCVFGDISRILNLSEAEAQQHPEYDGKKKLVTSESLSKYLIRNNLAIENPILQNSQLEIEDTDLKQSSRKSATKALGKSCPSEFDSSDDSDLEEEEFESKSEFISVSENVLVSGSSSETVEESIEEYPVQTEHHSFTQYDHLPMTLKYSIPGRLLLRGGHPRAPFNQLADALLPASILQAMKPLRIDELSEFQKLVMPNVLRGNDLIIVGQNSREGKFNGHHARLLAYILPILKLVYSRYHQKVQPKDEDCSPEAIIVVGSYNTGISFKSYIDSLLSYCQHLDLRVKFHCETSQEESLTSASKRKHSKRVLPKGISILITTADYLSVILKTSEGAKLCNKLEYIIFEEIELYIHNSWNDIILFVNTLKENARCTNRCPFQLMFSGSSWIHELEKLYDTLETMQGGRSATVIISGYNQALRFSKIQWIVYDVQEQDRIQKIQDIINLNRAHLHRTLIACSQDSIASKVYLSLVENTESTGLKILKITSNSGLEWRKSVLANWTNDKECVLVVPDEMIRNLNDVHNATRLICYDSPGVHIVGGKRRAVAAERFGYLWDNIRSIGKENQNLSILSKERTPLVAYFLMDGSEHNFYPLFKFAMDLNPRAEFPESLKAKALEMELEGSGTRELCSGLKLFGTCTKKLKALCPYRHEITRKDLTSAPLTPTSGELEIRIVDAYNPSHFTAQLLQHYQFENGKRVMKQSYISELDRRHKAMKEYFQTCGNVDPNLARAAGFFKVGGLYAVIHPLLKTYSRAKIDSMESKDEFQVPKTFRVQFVDIGDFAHPSGEAILNIRALSAEHLAWPELVVTVVLANLKPSKGEMEYRNFARPKVQQLIGKTLTAKIWLAIGDTVWVNPMVEYGLDPSTNKKYLKQSVRPELLARRLAESNANHLVKLADLVMKHDQLYKDQEALVNLNSFFKTSESRDFFGNLVRSFFQPGDTYRWAFVELTSDTKLEPVEILTMYGYTPWNFYGVHTKFEKELKNLEKDLNQEIEKYIKNKNLIQDHDIKDIDDDSVKESMQTATTLNYQGIFKDFYKPDLVVAAKEKIDNAWMRAIILSKTETTSTNNSYEVFFVDYGDTAIMTEEDLFPIPLKFVQRLPFQVIGFKLDHIQPIGSEKDMESDWSQKDKDFFLDTILPNSSSLDLRILAVENLTDEEPSDELPFSYNVYSVMAFDKSFSTGELGSSLVSKGVASLKMEKKNFVQGLQERFENQFQPNKPENTERKYDEFAFDLQDDAEELDDEKFDINFGHDSSLFNSMMEDLRRQMTKNMKPKEQKTILHDVNQSENSISKIITSAKSIPSSGMSLLKKSSKENEPAKSFNDGLLHPPVLWRQTMDTVVLTVKLPDITSYEFTIPENRTVSFRTLTKPKNYGFTLQLFGRVSKEFDRYLTGQYLRIVLKKKQTAEWIRILHDKQEKYNWLKPDLEYANCASDDDEEETAETSYDVSSQEQGRADRIRSIEKNLQSLHENDIAAEEEGEEEFLENEQRLLNKDYDDEDDDDVEHVFVPIGGGRVLA